MSERHLESYKKDVGDLLENSKKKTDQESEGHMHVNVRYL